MVSQRMEKTFWVVVLGVIAAACMAVSVQAEEETPSAAAEPQTQWQQGLQLTSTRKMMYTEVKSITSSGERGKTLGKVHDVIFDTTNEGVYGVIVSANNAYYPVPWQAFGLSCIEQEPEKTRKSGVQGAVQSQLQRLPWSKGPLCLRLDTEEFLQAPNMETLSLERLNDRAWKRQVCSYYQQHGMLSDVRGRGAMCYEPVQRYPEPAPAALVKASEVFDMHVDNYADTRLGEIEDVIVDVYHGALAYAAVDFGGALTWASRPSEAPEGVVQKTAAVPWTALNLDMTKRLAMLDATTDMLQTAEIKNGDLTQLTNPQFAREIHRTFEAEPYWEVFAFIPAEPTRAAWTAWQPGSTYNANYNTATVTIIEGTIRNVGTFRPEAGAVLGLRLRVWTTDSRSVVVYAGPREYAIRQGWTFEPGDLVMVRGSETRVNGKSVIMASQVGMKGKLLQLRNPQGVPEWKVESMGSRGM